jgi:hypothetical protein
MVAATTNAGAAGRRKRSSSRGTSPRRKQACPRSTVPTKRQPVRPLASHRMMRRATKQANRGEKIEVTLLSR